MTVKMKRGDLVADINNTPESIAHACSMGFIPVSETNPVTDPPVQGGNEQKNPVTNLADLSKDDLLQFAGKRKLYDKSFKDMEPAAIIPVILEKARARVVEAGLKTTEEAAALTEQELFVLFDSKG